MTAAIKNALLGQSITTLGNSESLVINPNRNVDFATNLTAQTGDYSTLRVNNTNVALSGHLHPISDIENLQSTLTNLSGISPANSQATNNLFLWSNFR